MTRTRTWPEPGSGTATSSMRKSVSDGSPGGRRARTTRRWVFGIIVCLSRLWARTGVGDGLRRYRTAHSPFQATVFPATPHWMLLRHGIAPGASILVRASQRVPLLQRAPDLLACHLGVLPQLAEIAPRDAAPLHHDPAVDDDRVDIVAHA